MFPLGILLIFLSALNCLVTSAPSIQIDVNESNPLPQRKPRFSLNSPYSLHSLDDAIFPFPWDLNYPLDTHDTSKLVPDNDNSVQPDHHFTLDKQSMKPKIEYVNHNGHLHSGKESSFNNPTFQWQPISFDRLPPLNVPSFQYPLYPQNNYFQNYQTMLPFPKFINNFPTLRPFSPMDTQNFPTLPPLSQMDEENFPSLPLFPSEDKHNNFPTLPPFYSKDKHNFPTLPPRKGQNNFPTLPSLGPFPTLPPLPPFPTQNFPTFAPFPTQDFPTLPPFSLLGKQNKFPKMTPLPLGDKPSFKKLSSTNKPYDIAEESVNMKIRFYDSNVADKKEPLQSNLASNHIQEQTSQNITSIETEAPTLLSQLFDSLFPKYVSNNEEDGPVNDYLLGQEISPDMTVLGVPLKCSQGRCFCPRLHYYDSHSGRCLHQNSVWSV